MAESRPEVRAWAGPGQLPDARVPTTEPDGRAVSPQSRLIAGSAGRLGARSVERLGGWSDTVRVHPRAFDAVLAFLVVALGLIAPALSRNPDPVAPNAGRMVTSAAGFALLLVRRKWPLMVLAWSVVGAIVLMATSDARNILLPVAVIAVFTVAAETDRRTAWLAGAATALALFTTGVLTSTDSWLAPENVGVIAWTGMATAIGDAVRGRRAHLAAVEERARRAEESREEEARHQVAEERLRIARELHDVLAHHIALINVQAGVATHVLREQPEQAEEALGHVRRAGRAVLDELSALVNVLREETPLPTEPAPGLQRLPHLLHSFAAAGLRVDSVVGGDPRSLPASVDLAAYRVVQEALTNVHKHGGGAAARLRLNYTAEELRIDVANVGGPGVAGTDSGRGHGIMGMRERASSVGGWVVAGPVDGGPFRLEASLPLQSPATSPVVAMPPPAVPVGSGWEGDGRADPGSAGR